MQLCGVAPYFLDGFNVVFGFPEAQRPEKRHFLSS
jgi:hypothetical protein